jgi:hypothetical protein
MKGLKITVLPKHFLQAEGAFKKDIIAIILFLFFQSSSIVQKKHTLVVAKKSGFLKFWKYRDLIIIVK